jgi:hypothetical protein
VGREGEGVSAPVTGELGSVTIEPGAYGGLPRMAVKLREAASGYEVARSAKILANGEEYTPAELLAWLLDRAGGVRVTLHPDSHRYDLVLRAEFVN